MNSRESSTTEELRNIYAQYIEKIYKKFPNCSPIFGSQEEASVNYLSKIETYHHYAVGVQSFLFQDKPVDSADLEQIANCLKEENSLFCLYLNLVNSTLSTDFIRTIASALKSKNTPPMIKFDLASANIGSEEVEILSKAINHSSSIRILELELGINNIYPDEQGLNALAALITNPLRPEAIELSLRGCPLENRENIPVENQPITILCNALKSSHAPKKISLNFNGCGFDDDNWNSITNAMYYNTSVVNIAPHSIPETYGRLIEILCLRNKLITQYPDFELFIKDESAKLGFYKREPGSLRQPQSLKSIAGGLFATKKIVISSEQEQLVPEEVKQYIATIESIYKELSCHSLASPTLK